MKTAKVYGMDFTPIVLKQLVIDCGIVQTALTEQMRDEMGVEVSRPTINLCLNRGYIPGTMPKFSEAMELIVGRNSQAVEWLGARGLRLNDIWCPLGKDLRDAKAAGHGKRIARGRHRALTAPDASEQKIINKEVEMITQEAIRHFKMFRNPFIDDIQKDTDVYMSDEHRYIEASMLDAAKHGGFLAIIGEVGSGKSVMRRKVVEALKRDSDTLIIYPQMIDKGRLTAGSICDAIILDVSSEKCRCKLEDKTRQVQRLLLDRAKSGYKACLIVEEAHDLKVQTLKFLKRFYELEDGYKKLLGIILIGQTELKHMFNEAQNVDMREVIRRVQVAEIRGLNGHLREYLEVKFRRVGVKQISDIFTDDAFEALSRRLTSNSRDGRSKISHAYPLTVNNYTARALNLACEMGEPKISGEVVDAI